MFDTEHRLVAAQLLECALEGLRGKKLIECVKEKFPRVTQAVMRRAAFLAVTRPNIEPKAVPSIYEVGVMLRAEGDGTAY